MHIKIISVILAVISAFFNTLYYRIAGFPETAVLSEELISDGTPKKYFVLSFDDGITQDKRIIEICKKYDFDGCTFNINTGLYGENWTWVGESMNRPDVTHKRFTKAEIEEGIYDGFDVEAHTLSHPSLKNYDNDPYQIYREVQDDAKNIYELTGLMPLGMAWPGGDTEYTDETVETVLKYTTIRFARATTPTYKFTLPERFMKWYPTCSVTDSRLSELTKEFLNAEAKEDMLFFVWGHGYELDAADYYDEFEELIKTISQADDIIPVTSAELYLIFKDTIPS